MSRYVKADSVLSISKAFLLSTTLLTISGAAFAQTAVNTNPAADPRRQDGARIVTQPNTSTRLDQTQDANDLSESYQPKGITLGSFLLLPKVELDETYNDNIYAEEHGKNSDFITTLRPSFKLQSQLPLHAINLSGELEGNRYAKYDDDSTINGKLTADGRYDVTTTTTLTGLADFTAYHEERGSDDDANGKKPTAAKSGLLRLGGKTQVGSFTYSAEGSLDRRVFDDVSTSAGTNINNSDRDRYELTGTLRGGYEFFPGYAAVVALTGNQRTYDQNTDDNGFERDSHGYRIEGGLGVDISQLIRGDFLVGYLQQNYKDPGLKDPKGFAMRATFNWTPSRMTLIVPSLERSVMETTIANTSSVVRTTGSLMVRHELARNILATVYGGVYYDEYSGVSQDALTWEVQARLTYAFTENVFVSGEIGHKSKDSDFANRSFDQNFIGVRLGLQL